VANRSGPRAVIFGVAGTELSAAERRLFADACPLGFILFARNCAEPRQVRDLVQGLRGSVGREDAPIVIDQEGGRVRRLNPPHWRAAPPPACFARLAAKDPETARRAAYLNARLLAAELVDLGIDVNTLPVLDLPQPDSHPVIGDRAAGDTVERAAALGRATCEGLLAGGVLPVIKHVPGHGRARVDSHVALPVVDTARDELERTDFAPFRRLSDMPWAMTAHVVYAAIDGERPATTSPEVIDRVIRGWIGFDGLLLSDDLCMGALGGAPAGRARAVLAAGCDVALHCDGVLAEMAAVAEACPEISAAGARRLAQGEALRQAASEFDAAAATARLAQLLGDAAG
jgi:beta-N-acetylhexosaminidase